ncbi:putative ankyrin repeat protein RF_0381 [Cotesia glomerata]|uniref:putative ankyrin repeat protein RF_0381 n=1 Tax=Cotesia glomerata TaxID=32391 RepID=UPI001D014091|nr:putative ankyrin repeat protein RF_0381 [Cotesia glomerata]
MDEADEENLIKDIKFAIVNEDIEKFGENMSKLKSLDAPCWLYGYRPLCIAYKNRKDRFAEKFLELNFVQVNNNFGINENTPLHWAVIHNESKYSLGIIDKLLQKGAEMTSENSLRQNVFDVALQKKNFPVLELLVDHISESNINKSTYLKLLLDFINSDYIDLAEKLLTKWVDIDLEKSMGDFNFLNLAVEKKQFKVVKSLLNRGINVNYYDKSVEDRVTAIYKACEVGDFEIFKFLLDNGANIDIERVAAQYNPRYYPIHIAIANNHLDIVKELLDRGVDVNKTYVVRIYYNGDKFEKTTLQLACAYKHLDIVKLLIERGADIHLKINDSGTPIYEAFPAEDEDYELFTYLLGLNNLRLDLDAAKYIVFWCAIFNQTDKLILLLQYIKKLNLKDRLRYELDMNVFNNANLKEPLIHSAARNSSGNCIDLLIKNDVDVNLRNHKGRTALHVALRYRQFESIIGLIRNGADINITCNEGHSASHYTVDKKIRESRFDTDDDDESCEDFDGFQESSLTKIVNYYGYLIIKLKYLDLFVDDSNYNFAINTLNDPFKHQGKYEKEVKKMKKKIIHSAIPYVTYYNFVKGSLNRRINFLNNPQIFKVLDSRDNYASKFPQFADIINNLFHQALVRKKLLDKVNNYPIFRFLNKNLPYLCVKEVICYFSDGELKDVVNKYIFFD